MNWSTNVPSAGIFVGPAAWIINQQLNYMLVPWICAHQVRLVPIVAVVMAAICLAAAVVSWRGYRAAGPEPVMGSPQSGQPHRFVGMIGVAIALLFAVAILAQGAAGLVFHGCER
jgi:hypothetical protein